MYVPLLLILVRLQLMPMRLFVSHCSARFLVMPCKILGRASATFGRGSENERFLALWD